MKSRLTGALADDPCPLQLDAIMVDELADALLNRERNHTISAHCGAKIIVEIRCPLCRGLCWLLERVWPGHCHRAAVSEFLIKR
jgi:hypothetical protein